MARIAVALLIGLAWLAPAASARPLDAPVAHASATCADYRNQAAAQRAADTRDADGDGVYCESLPCPCLTPGAGRAPTPRPTAPAPSQRSCQHPRGVQNITFSKTEYPHIRAHF